MNPSPLLSEVYYGSKEIADPDDEEGEVYYTTYQGPDCPEPPSPEPPPVVAVGGEVFPVNKVTLLAPWIALAVVVIIGGAVLIRRRAHN